MRGAIRLELGQLRANQGDALTNGLQRVARVPSRRRREIFRYVNEMNDATRSYTADTAPKSHNTNNLNRTFVFTYADYLTLLEA